MSRPIISLFPKIQFTKLATGSVEAWCGGCGTRGIIVNGGSQFAFELRHTRCRNDAMEFVK